jgi:O-antigen biosynthesis protein
MPLNWPRRAPRTTSTAASRRVRRFLATASGFIFVRTAFRRRWPRASRFAVHFAHVVALAAADNRLAEAEPEALKSPQPLISFVVPVFDAKLSHLDDLLESFERQPPGFCELILSDDGSTASSTREWLKKHSDAPGVKMIWGSTNRGIAAATNDGIARATAPWIGLLDHDDALAPFAVDRIVRALEQAPECQFLYTDEAIADEKLRIVDYFLKPAWDPVLLSGVNYINHLSLYRRERVLQIGGLRDSFQGSQDYDLVLRYTKDLKSAEIRHLPYPAYIWRRHPSSHSVQYMGTATASARRALTEHFHSPDDERIVGEALTPDLHRVLFDMNRERWPLVSVVIPNRDGLALITEVLEGLTKRTDYPAMEIIVIDNGSKDPDVLALYSAYRERPTPFQVRIEEETFNFSRSINRGAAMATGAFVLLLNNDIEIADGAWLKEMVSCFDYGDVGVVGAKLLYPDQTIQHVGVIAGLGDLAGHWFIGRDKHFPGPMGRLRVRQSLSVVTGACMLVAKQCLDSVGGLDEVTFPIAYNDVDFCLRAVKLGFRVVWTPFATLVHHESATRGDDETPENIDRFNRDKDNLRRRHRTDLFEDRAFNPWHSKHHSDFFPLPLDRLPPSR